MKLKELIEELTKLAEENPEFLEYETAQQDCFSSPRATTGCMNVYVGHYYETESGGYLDPKNAEAADEEVTDNYPVIVVESF